MLLDRAPGQSVEFVEVTQGLRGLEIFAEEREIPNAAEEHRGMPRAAFKNARVLAGKHFIDHGRRNVAGEHLAHALRLAPLFEPALKHDVRVNRQP